MTETSSLAASIGGADYEARPTSVGVPVPMLDVRIVDERRPRRRRRVRSASSGWPASTVVAGYWNRPEATDETFGGGWLQSGDLARIDDEGFLYIVDRAKDMVIRGGENISSLEVEAALFDHPDVTRGRGVRSSARRARRRGRRGRAARRRRERNCRKSSARTSPSGSHRSRCRPTSGSPTTRSTADPPGRSRSAS